MRKSCTVCGLDLRPLAAEDGPAFFIIVIISAVILPLAVAIEFMLEPPIWVHILIWPPLVIGGAIAMLRPAKAMLIAQHHKHLSEPETGQ